MAAPQPPPAPRMGMSLYANLVDSEPDPSARISREPVLFRQHDAPKKAIDPVLRFQPIRRPQVKQASKSKPPFPKAASVSAAQNSLATTKTSSPATDLPRNTLADWAATEEDEFLYGGARGQRQRGGRRRKKKKTENEPLETDWDELYDPARPTNVDEYLRSDERIGEMREWKDVLYAHRRRRSTSSPPRNHAFAPPPASSFAPQPISPPRPAVSDDNTGDDAYARRSVMSGQAPDNSHALQHGATISRAPVRYEPPPPAPPTEEEDDDDDDDDQVDYDAILVPPADHTEPPDGNEPARTNRPGQAGFARRLMAKYGWATGTGLGADGAGITSALRVKVEKRRRRPDAEGGGFVDPGARGTILGGKPAKKKKKKSTDDPEHERADDHNNAGFGPMSAVVVLRNMLENMPDLAAEVEAGLGQEIGEECGEKYGRVERVYIDVVGRQVFIKFTDQVSALRAVNALDGRVFNGNPIEPKFYDADKFENAMYS